MDAVEEVEGYKPDSGFEEDSRAPLADLNLSDSTELWLVQWPLQELPELDGKELLLCLDGEGCLGSFKDSSGKAYDLVSCSAHQPDATVFLSSSSETNIAGKISRRVSLVHYPDPQVLEKQEAEKSSKQFHQMRAGSSLMNSSNYSGTTTPSSKQRHTQMSWEHAASTHSSRYKSSLSEAREQSSSKKQKHKHEHSRSTDQSTLDSGRGHCSHAFSGSSGLSKQGKLKEEASSKE